MPPASRPALSWAVPSVAETCSLASAREAQRQRAVLELVGQLVGGGLGEAAGDLGLPPLIAASLTGAEMTCAVEGEADEVGARRAVPSGMHGGRADARQLPSWRRRCCTCSSRRSSGRRPTAVEVSETVHSAWPPADVRRLRAAASICVPRHDHGAEQVGDRPWSCRRRRSSSSAHRRARSAPRRSRSCARAAIRCCWVGQRRAACTAGLRRSTGRLGVGQRLQRRVGLDALPIGSVEQRRGSGAGADAAAASGCALPVAGAAGAAAWARPARSVVFGRRRRGRASLLRGGSGVRPASTR